MAVALLVPAPAARARARAAPQSVLGAAQALGGAQPVAPVAPVAAPAVEVGVVTGEQLVQMATGALEGAAQPWLCWDCCDCGAFKSISDVGSHSRILRVDDAWGYSQESSGTIP